MDEKPGPGGPFRVYARQMHLGIQFILTIGLLLFIGYWVDGKLGTRPWVMLTGLGLGFGVAFYNLYREVYGEKRGR